MDVEDKDPMLVAARLANKAYDFRLLKVGELVCSLDVDNLKIHKISSIGEDTVDIILPDMIPIKVSKSSLYDYGVVEMIFLRHKFPGNNVHIVDGWRPL